MLRDRKGREAFFIGFFALLAWAKKNRTLKFFPRPGLGGGGSGIGNLIEAFLKKAKLQGRVFF